MRRHDSLMVTAMAWVRRSASAQDGCTVLLHSRGPVGLEGLTTYKYLLEGDGQIVADYSGPDARSYTHRTIDKTWTRTS